MARYYGPKNKLARRIGEDLGLKTNALKVAKRLKITPGMHGHKGRRKTSDFGIQLKEKQKVKYLYGIMEKQLHKLYVAASKNPTATGTALLSLLERRLDNVVYRAGWLPTRAAARQFVNHSHVLVNGKKLNIPSYSVKVNDVIIMKEKGAKLAIVSDRLKELSAAPAWMEVKGPALKISRLPQREDILENIEEQLIVEYYSR